MGFPSLSLHSSVRSVNCIRTKEPVNPRAIAAQGLSRANHIQFFTQFLKKATNSHTWMSIAALCNASLILSEEQSPTSDGGQDDEVERHHFGTSTFGGRAEVTSKKPFSLARARRAEVHEGASKFLHIQNAAGVDGATCNLRRAPSSRMPFQVDAQKVDAEVVLPWAKCTSIPDSLYQISGSGYAVAYRGSCIQFLIRLSDSLFSHPSHVLSQFWALFIGVFLGRAQGRRRRLPSAMATRQFSFEIKMTSHFFFSSFSPRDCLECSAPPKVTSRVPDPTREMDDVAEPAAAILHSERERGSKVMERRRRERLID